MSVAMIQAIKRVEFTNRICSIDDPEAHTYYISYPGQKYNINSSIEVSNIELAKEISEAINCAYEKGKSDYSAELRSLLGL